WRGKNVMRAVPENVRDARTPKQLAQREKFRLVSAFLKSVRPVVSAGFEVPSGADYDSNNAALSYNLKYATDGEYPSLFMDYTSVRVAMGSLEGVLNGNAEADAAGELSISWADNSGSANARPSDSALILAYSPELGQAVYASGSQSREDSAATLGLPESFAGQELHVWLAFTDDGRKISSNSSYLGTVTAL
ncbi:MAG: DUF6266 family protein, partial [Balneolia bacterium]|nr:DUF6266 family protein [Balneolia bacterium]